MAVSPTVNAYIVQDQLGQLPESDQIFRQKFVELAFASLRSKFPKLVPLVITFKIIEANVETGFALATFIVRSNNDIKYIPVVLVDGVIVSCEMIYDKKTNSIMPLLPKVVDALINDNIREANLVDKPVRIDNTSNLFRQIVRPPASSQVILASTHVDLGILPNEAKEALAVYLQNNPDILAKIAEYYPPEALAQKLAVKPEISKVSEEVPSVISIDDVTKKITTYLSPEEREALLVNDFAVLKKNGVNETVVLSETSLAEEVEKFLKAQQLEYNSIAEPISCILYSITGKGFSEEPAIVCSCDSSLLIITKNKIVQKHNYSEKKASLVAGDVQKLTFDECVNFFPWKDPSDITDSNVTNMLIMYPKKDGMFGLVYVHAGSITVNKSDEIVVYAKYSDEVLRFTDDIKYGYIKNGNIFIFPLASKIYIGEFSNIAPYVSSIQDIVNYLRTNGTTLRVVKDGTSYSIIEDNKYKTFVKKAEAARYLVEKYNLDAGGVTNVLSNHKVILFNKTAQVGTAQPVTQNTQGQPVFDKNLIQDAANIGDKDILDTGMLAAFNDYLNIKDNFLELFPVFVNTITALGRVILICVTNKNDLERYYGRENYTTFLGSCRNVFNKLGEIVASMKSYTNMISDK